MSTLHIVHGKPVTHGHIVHYRDDKDTTHAAVITNIAPSTDDHLVDLHVFDRVSGEGKTVKAVPHSLEGKKHSWQHLPY